MVDRVSLSARRSACFKGAAANRRVTGVTKRLRSFLGISCQSDETVAKNSFIDETIWEHQQSRLRSIGTSCKYTIKLSSTGKAETLFTKATRRFLHLQRIKRKKSIVQKNSGKNTQMLLSCFTVY